MEAPIHDGYPWRGLRLAPATLRDVLGVPIPQHVTPRGEGSEHVLADLGQDAWDRYDAGACRVLADAIVDQVRQMAYKLPPQVARRRLPILAPCQALHTLGLSTRTYNALARAGFALDPGRLAVATVGEVMRIRSVGAKGLVELLVALEEKGASRADSNSNDRANHGADPVASSAFSGGLTFDEAVLLGAWCRGEIDSLPHPLYRKRLPPIPGSTHLDDLDVSPRTGNALRNGGYLDIGRWLSDATIGDVLRVPRLGRVGLADLLDAVTRLLEQPSPRSDITTLAETIARMDGIEAIRTDDVRIAKLASSVCRAGETLSAAAVRISQRARDPHDANAFHGLLQGVKDQIERYARLSLEQELVDIAVAASDARNGLIFSRYLGWDGQGGAVLQTVGEEFGITRERVRQVCGKVERRLAGTRPYAPVLRRCLEVIRNRAPAWSDKIELALASEGLIRGVFGGPVPLEAASVLGIPSGLVVETVDGRPFVRRADDDAAATIGASAKAVRHVARRAIEHWGAARIEDVVTAVLSEGGSTIDSDFVVDVLTHVPSFSWLDQPGGWFWLADVPRNRVLNQVEKVVSVAQSIGITELRTAVARNYRMEGHSPPRRVLAELCRQSPRYRVEDDVVRADPPLCPSEVLAETELTFTNILAAHGRIMSRAALEDECRRRGMNKVTFYVYLKNSPILTCPRRGVYALVGAAVEPGRLEALAVRPMRSRVIQDSGWTADRKLWIVYRLSQNMLTSGVFGLPAGAKSIIHGDFTLLDDRGIKVGTIRSRDTGTWGLGPFYHRRGGAPGDYLALTFNLVTREAVATLGDRSILDRFAYEGGVGRSRALEPVFAPIQATESTTSDNLSSIRARNVR